jgi:hypothetical protein
MSEHVILVAVTVEAETREEAHTVAQLGMPRPGARYPTGKGFATGLVTSWWVAEDDRQDGSDCDSAVFVTPGTQAQASRRLYMAGLTPRHNIVDRDVRGQFEYV